MSKLDTGRIGSILIRGTNWVGDSVIAIPAMREIRRIFPAAKISLLVRPWVKEIYSSADFIDELIPYDKTGLHKGWSGFRKLASDLKKRRFDLAILQQNAFEAALLAFCARIPARVGYARDGRGVLLTHPCRISREVRGIHQAYYYLDILSQMCWLPDRLWQREEYKLVTRIDVPDPSVRAAQGLLHTSGIHQGDAVVGINPGAFYGSAKRWFPERYAAVADRLVSEYNARIVILGSSSDMPVAKQVAAAMTSPAVILAGQTSLGQLMGLLRECRLLITNDSGPMHLAAALDVPQLAIFGSTDEIATGPLSAKAVVIKHPVDCNPCLLRECPTDFRCMRGISSDRVLEEARKILQPQTAARRE